MKKTLSILILTLFTVSIFAQGARPISRNTKDFSDMLREAIGKEAGTRYTAIKFFPVNCDDAYYNLDQGKRVRQSLEKSATMKALFDYDPADSTALVIQICAETLAAGLASSGIDLGGGGGADIYATGGIVTGTESKTITVSMSNGTSFEIDFIDLNGDPTDEIEMPTDCTDGQIAVWNLATTEWVCADKTELPVCTEVGQVIAWDGTDYICSEALNSLTEQVNENTSDIADNAAIINQHLSTDNDTDNTNEYNTSTVIRNDSIFVVDAGGETFSGMVSSVALADQLTIDGDGTTGDEFKVNTTIIATKTDIDELYFWQESTNKKWTCQYEKGNTEPLQCFEICQNSTKTASDTDGDGIPNDIDTDDDNDGISDVDEDLGTNVVPSGTATAEGGTNINAPLDNSTSFWFSGTVQLPAWWQVELDGITIINKVIVKPYYVDGRSYTFNIETSIDGVEFEQVAEKTDASAGTATGYEYDFDGKFVKFVRVNFLTSTASNNAHLIQVQAFSIDFDNDGIVNSQDLDSDNDGCFDAIEGGASLTLADLNYDGSLIATGTIQGTGDSQDASAANCDDSVPYVACALINSITESEEDIIEPYYVTIESDYGSNLLITEENYSEGLLREDLRDKNLNLLNENYKKSGEFIYPASWNHHTPTIYHSDKYFDIDLADKSVFREVYMQKNENGVTYYVDIETGNDASDGLSEATALKTIEAAKNKSDVLTIMVKSGVYFRGNGFVTAVNDKDINIIGYGGEVIVGSIAANQAMTTNTSYANVFQLNIPNISGVSDARNKDEKGVHLPYQLVNSIQEVSENPKSWFYSSGVLYVHSSSSPVWNEDIFVTIIGIENRVLSETNASNSSVYLENLTFVGGVEVRSGFAGNKFYAQDCVFENKHTSGSAATARFDGLQDIALSRCISAYSGNDAFNYHDNMFNNSSPTVIEINCIGYAHGMATNGSNQASTAHEDVKIIRVNGVYEVSTQEAIFDVGNSSSLNLGNIVTGVTQNSVGHNFGTTENCFVINPDYRGNVTRISGSNADVLCWGIDWTKINLSGTAPASIIQLGIKTNL